MIFPRILDKCDVCGGKLHEALRLGSFPQWNDLVPIGDDRECARFPIDIWYCDRCCTAHQHFQIPKRELYTPNYAYRSREAFAEAGMRDLVAQCRAHYGPLAGRSVLDVGCNDGTLLDIFAEQGCETYGIEPTDAAHDAIAKGHTVQQGFFEPGCTGLTYDIVTFTNVFAHIEDMNSLCLAVKEVCHSGTLLVIENHYLGSVLDKCQFDTFYHEHLRTYSATSFLQIATKLGMYVTGIQYPERYGGNVRVFMRDAIDGQSTVVVDPPVREVFFGGLLQGMEDRITKWKHRKREQILAFHDIQDGVPMIAMPARSPLLVGMLEFDNNEISAVYQLDGSPKIGHYVPGTRIPIVSDSTLVAQEQGKIAVNLAWHIRPAVDRHMVQLGFNGKLVDIISPGDFS